MTIEEATDRLDGTDALPRQQQLIVSLFGLYARQRGGVLAVADLIALLGDLGAEEPAVRSAVSRLKKRGLLTGSRINGVATYAPSEQLVRLLGEGDTRIFAPRRAAAGDAWLLAAFTVPESQRNLRHVIRSLLTRRGFGSVTPGLWIAPEWLFDSTWNELDRQGLTGYVHFFRAEPLGDTALRDRVEAAWNLPALQELYCDFIDRFEPVLATWTGAGEQPTDLEAFRAFVPLVTLWRRLPYLDPGLPLEYLPNPWPGQIAADLFRRLTDMLEEPADRHAQSRLSAVFPA